MPSSFHPHALRHLTTRSARVRSRSQPLFSIVPGLSSEPSPEPLGGCRCALLSLCLSLANRRTERHARLAFSRSAGLAHRLSQLPADHVSLHACPARHCSAPWSLCAQVFLQNGKLLPPVITAQQPLLSAAPASVSCGRSRSRVPSSFRLTPLRHLPPLCFGRSRSQPSASIRAICHRDLSSSPLGGCRCALCL